MLNAQCCEFCSKYTLSMRIFLSTCTTLNPFTMPIDNAALLFATEVHSLNFEKPFETKVKKEILNNNDKIKIVPLRNHCISHWPIISLAMWNGLGTNYWKIVGISKCCRIFEFSQGSVNETFELRRLQIKRIVTVLVRLWMDHVMENAIAKTITNCCMPANHVCVNNFPSV